MRFTSRYQQASPGTIAVVAGTVTITVIPAPGATKRLRIFAVDLVLDEGLNARVRANVRESGSTVFARLGLSQQSPADHVHLNEGGYALVPNTACDIALQSTVAGNVHYVIRYITEG